MTLLAASFPPGKGGLNVDEVGRVIRALDKAKMSQGRISPATGVQVADEIRSGSVQWLQSDEVGEDIYSHLFTLAVVANRERNWNFEITGMAPALQATCYVAEGNQHYTWHMDWGLGPTRNRKIAVVAHLSDESEFEGGQLEMTNGATPGARNTAKANATVMSGRPG